MPDFTGSLRPQHCSQTFRCPVADERIPSSMGKKIYAKQDNRDRKLPGRRDSQAGVLDLVAGTLHPHRAGAHVCRNIVDPGCERSGHHRELRGWDETPESFMQEQRTRSYRAVFEKLIVDLKIELTPPSFHQSQRGNGLARKVFLRRADRSRASECRGAQPRSQ